MKRYLAELMALPLYPLLAWQGQRTRKMTPRLPEASGPCHGTCRPEHPTPQRFRLLSIGESPVAGVGVNNHQEAITAQFAQTLARQYDANVEWQAFGQNGADLALALASMLPKLPHLFPEIDLVLIAFGVNDTTAFRSVTRYRRELHGILDAVMQQLKPKQILLSGVPPVHAFPALPQPLRLVLGTKAAALDQVAIDVAEKYSQVMHVPMHLDVKDHSLMAHDGFHPSAKGVQLWAMQLLKVFERNWCEK
ncbi:MAG: SGNH/GDSL hydrolase family protein [Undibacterium sp.]|uniref:SGNH/GDSL hydrolase family protein n=1 Tax=Undibacterium sp. TaxID=1914977 RepID=UPI0027267339|nr:SGNH/GDSL hydrolase family protein [Undibacterium sp.]MDO8654032.1 SGNH/GDSL hydrolase family protein [Undibacterium sp.]